METWEDLKWNTSEQNGTVLRFVESVPFGIRLLMDEGYEWNTLSLWGRVFHV
jgi:hypothetical protein